MPQTQTEQTAAAQAFVTRWQNRQGERSNTQAFWLDLLSVLGVETPSEFIEFEDAARMDTAHGFIDAYIPSTRVLIEQKSATRDLNATTRQSDGTALTPFQQALRYAAALPVSRHPRWIVTCNFRDFMVHDMEQMNAAPEIIHLADLPHDLYRLHFLVTTRSTRVTREMDVSFEAGRIVGRIYDALLAQYGNTRPETLRWLNILCVRLVFCLYAEDADIFRDDQFHEYLVTFPPERCRRALMDLFAVLDTPPEDRSPYLAPDLAAFPYVNGGLFSEEIDIPIVTAELRETILQEASLGFDWSDISPTIFGAVFESTLNPETRRAAGMHYTSIENIHKVIDPLFLDGLHRELSDILSDPVPRTRNAHLREYQTRLASLSFLDPACGSGNFLTETYLCLRRFENEAIASLIGRQSLLDLDGSTVKVSISQFHGIEINDFAVAVAKTALWISESQMLAQTAKLLHRNLEFLPLKSYDGIAEGNALRTDWQALSSRPVDYIIGNPPFIGARLMSDEQKADLADVFGPGWRSLGNLDYVTGWYKKAADYMADHPATRTALVSTNSVCQGEAPAILWKPLFADGVSIDFAHRTFRWDSESSGMAHVHCVIVGFSRRPQTPPLPLYDGGRMTLVPHINAYLTPAPDSFVENRTRPLCNVPEISIGSQPIDDGQYLFTPEEKAAFLESEPAAAPYFHPWLGSQEFINGIERWCLWLGDCPPTALRSMRHCMDRVAHVREFRSASNRAQTRRSADTPYRFGLENIPSSTFILIPKVSSERRRYVPMGFIPPTTFCSDLVFLVPNATLYHLGVLTSNVHMAWMRAVAGRLKSDYRYSANIVYNNFPWPTPTSEQTARIEATAQGILDARAAHPNASLAALYDQLTMPSDLLEAHRANDRAVLAAYGFPARISEVDCVAALFGLYNSLVAAN